MVVFFWHDTTVSHAVLKLFGKLWKLPLERFVDVVGGDNRGLPSDGWRNFAVKVDV
jgi:hypothetical protein